MSYSLKIAFISIILIFSKVQSSHNFFRALQPGDQPGGEPGGQPGSDTTSVTYTAEYTYSSTNCLATNKVSSDDADENVILVEDGATLTLNTVTVNKTGDASNTENAEFYGLNAAVLVTNSSKGVIYNSTIITNGKGANAVFSFGSSSKIEIFNSTIDTTGASSSRGLLATYTGTINAYNLFISTTGGSCATLATDRGEGVVTCLDCKLITAGKGSPVVYSTGTITIDGTTGSALVSQMVVVEGANSALIKNSNLYSFSKGNRDTNVDSSGIFIYQSTSGDANEGVGSFAAVSSNFTIFSNSTYYNTAPMFFVTNAEATITLLGGNTFNYGSGEFLKADTNTENWGTSGSNGGTVTLYVKGETINGNITSGSNSSITIYLTEGSSLTGKITATGTVNIYIDSTSKWTLTDNSVVTNYQSESSSNIVQGKYSLTGNSVNTLSSFTFPVTSISDLSAITTSVDCSNTTPDDDGDDDDDDDSDSDSYDSDSYDDSDSDNDSNKSRNSNKGKFLYINFLSLFILIITL